MTTPLAEATQEEVLRSIGKNVGEGGGDSGRVLAMVMAAGGAVVLLIVVAQRRGAGGAGPKPLHSHSRLIKEVLRTVPLKQVELKQLQLLLQESRARGGDGPVPESPLTLVLCPSVLLKAAQARSDKVNRKVVAGLARKLGEHQQR